MPNLLERLPVTPTVGLIRNRRQMAGRMLLLWAGIQLVACLTIPLALRSESMGSLAGVWFIAGLGIVFSFPVSCAFFSVLPTFSMATRFWGTVSGLFFWISAQWLGRLSSHYLPASQPIPTLEQYGLNLIPLVPAFMLGLTLPLMLTKGFLGTRITFPIWEPTDRQPTWSISGLFLVTFWFAIVITIAQRNQNYTSSSAFLVLCSAGVSTLFLPIVATILNAKHYLFWFCFTLTAVATLSGLAFLLVPVLGQSFCLFLTSFFGFTCIAALIARFSGAKLVRYKSSQLQDPNSMHQKLP